MSYFTNIAVENVNKEFFYITESALSFVSFGKNAQNCLTSGNFIKQPKRQRR
jgi:hypothetical protein